MRAPAAATGHVDELVYSKSHIIIRGWAFDPKTKSLPDLQVTIGGEPASFELATVERQDIRKKLGFKNADLGYQLKVPVAEIIGRKDLRIAVNDKKLYSPILEKLSSPTEQDVKYHVLDASTRPDDPSFLYFASRHLVSNDNLRKHIRAGCLCVWGYRLIEADWDDTEQLKDELSAFMPVAEKLLAELDTANLKEPQIPRWITSVRLCRAWCSIVAKDHASARKDFAAILNYLHHLASEPGLILTLVNSAFMLGLLSFRSGNRIEAAKHWGATVNIAQIAIGRQKFGLSYYQFDEINFAMVAAKNASFMLASMQPDSEPVPARKSPSADLFDLNLMFRPIPRLNKLGLLEGTPAVGDQVAVEKDKYEQMWNLPIYRANHCNVAQVDNFITMVSMPAGASVLDIGCGPGYAARRFADQGMKPLCIDIAANALNEENRDLPFLRTAIWQVPVKIEADYGFCTDMMEHIPPDQIDKTLAAIKAFVKGEVYFEISTRRDYSGQLIGQTLHLTVNPSKWWLAKLQKFWPASTILSENAEDQSANFLAR